MKIEEPDMTAITKTKSNLSPVQQVAREWRCFRRVRPLKIGIRTDLLLRSVDAVSTIAALEAFTSTREYYLACRAGAPRYDLFGRKVGAVSAAEQAYADSMLGLLEQIQACRQ